MSEGYVFMTAICGSCKRPFSFNPLKVPSLNNVPFCKHCVDAANSIRKEKGLPPIVYADDAYEPMLESELPYDD